MNRLNELLVQQEDLLRQIKAEVSAQELLNRPINITNINEAISVISRAFSLEALDANTKDLLASMLLQIALKARGYNNYENSHATGEKYFIENILKSVSPAVCIDIGANVGAYAREILENTNALVYAFEPLSEPFAELMRLQDDFGDRLILINNGVGARDETLTIHFSKEASEHASFSEEVKNVPYVKNELSREVEVVTLDTFFGNEGAVSGIDLIKIDTEGFEYEVLCGASKVIAQYKPKFIHIEFNWHQLFKGQSLFSFSKVLHEYQVFQMLPGRLVKRDPRDPYANIYHFSNFVFIRNDLLATGVLHIGM